MTTRLIEHEFPIVALNPLSARERNAFRPVYKMHKWFARRSSSIFRAILLGAAFPAPPEPGGTSWMEEFYRPHLDDARLRTPEGQPLTILDPFMGGGTTVVEALRLGLKVVGVDYNPIAWFIVRGETASIDLKALQRAYARVEAEVKDTLLELYRTRCPLTGQADADIIYAFWVKQGVCVSPTCRGRTDLFKNYVVGKIQGDLGLFYYPDVQCPHCYCNFDWEVERCTITAGGPQVLGTKAAGKQRPDSAFFAYGSPERGVPCPNCATLITLSSMKRALPKREKKKILIQAVLDPTTGDLFEVRGELPKQVQAPLSGHVFDPQQGPAASGGFTCRACGRQQKIVESVDAHGAPLPFRLYAFYASTPNGRIKGTPAAQQALALGLPTNNMKWFARATEDDLTRVAQAQQRLELQRDRLPLPDQEIFDGYNTNRLVIHGYKRWSQLFGDRQLLALGLLLRAIAREPEPTLRDALLGAFQSHLDATSNLVSYNFDRNMIREVTAAHDFRNPTTIAEGNTWGTGEGQRTFSNCYEKVVAGLEYVLAPDLVHLEKSSIPVADQRPEHWSPKLLRGSADALEGLEDRSIDLVISDPPYAGSVQYAEMSDFFYVWLHKVLKDHYPEFGPEITLKSQEIIEDGAEKGPDWFFEQLTGAWRECHRVLKDEGLLVFTFHHKEGDRWSGLLRSLFDAGFYLVAAYPTHSEALNSIVIQATQGITYDIIHVCRKRLEAPRRIAWPELRRQVRQEARLRLRELERGGQLLPTADVRIILLSTALRLFSQHYGQVLEGSGAVVSLEQALEKLSELVQEVRGEDVRLPEALQRTDQGTQFYLLILCRQSRWVRDDLHKELRGFRVSLEELLEAGLLEPDPTQKDQLTVLEPLQRAERCATRLERIDRDSPLVDILHRVLGVAHSGMPLEPLLERLEGVWSVVSEGLQMLCNDRAELRTLGEATVRAIERMGPEKSLAKDQQLDLLTAGKANPLSAPRPRGRRKES